jgi:hypothetical protein
MLARLPRASMGHAVLLTEHAAKHAHRACPGLAGERASRAKGSLLAASLPSPARLAVPFSPTDRSSNSFSCNTYRFPRNCCKKKTYDRAKPFSCNTYKKHRGEGVTSFKPKALPSLRPASGPTPSSLSLFPISYPLPAPQQSRGIPFLFILFQTLLPLPKTQLFSFQAIPNSFAKTPGVGEGTSC